MKSCKGVVGLSLLLTAMAAIGSPASAAQLEAKTAVLVHGAFADGSSWQRVIPFLEKAGLKVIAVQNPLDSLDNDVAATKRAIRNAEGPVVLVGHSWSWRRHHGSGKRRKGQIARVCRGLRAGQRRVGAERLFEISRSGKPENVRQGPGRLPHDQRRGHQEIFRCRPFARRTGSRGGDAGSVPRQEPHRSDKPSRVA